MFGIKIGSTFQAPLFTRHRPASGSNVYRSALPHGNPRGQASFYEDFCGAVINPQWACALVQTAGTAVGNIDTAIENGQVDLALDATSEAQSARLSWND